MEKDVTRARTELIKLPGIVTRYNVLMSFEQKHFQYHLRQYINIYLPCCPFEVNTTVLYAATEPEACVQARKRIVKGEMIKYLSGTQVEMTEADETELCTRAPFSIIESSRKRRPSLFLGPARFVNHDCNANASLKTRGCYAVDVLALTDITPGEEITVDYGDHYFGDNNCRCLCLTCKQLLRNGHAEVRVEQSDSSRDKEVLHAEDQRNMMAALINQMALSGIGETLRATGRSHDPGAKCRDCSNGMIDGDDQQMCPRCKRHRKLYGFIWPKTSDYRQSKPIQCRRSKRKAISPIAHKPSPWHDTRRKTTTVLPGGGTM